MKRLTGRNFFNLGALAALVLVGAALAGVTWVAGTTQGARWFLSTAMPLGGARLSVQKVEGRMAGHVVLTGVRLTLPLRAVELDTLELRWKPLMLLVGTVAFQELTIGGIRIQDDTPPDSNQPIPAWPKPSGTARLFDVTIMRLRVTDVSYRHLREQPVLVSSVAGSVTWRDDHLSLTDLRAVSPLGELSGVVSAGFNKPALTADLAIVPAHPVARMDRFNLKARPGGGMASEKFVESVAVVGSAGEQKLLEFGCDAEMTRSAVNLRRITLARPGRKGMLTGDGSVSLGAGEPVLTVQVTGTGLDLAPELKMPTNLSGTLTFTGTLENYRGDFTCINKGDGWQGVTVSAAYHGTREEVSVAPLTASVIGGTLTGKLDMSWRDRFALQGTFGGRNLNLALIDPALNGVVNFKADGTLAWSGNEPVTGSVGGVLLDSRLHGQSLTGSGALEFSGANLSVTRLALQGKGFSFHASGDLNKRLVMDARIGDFSRLVPGAAGTLRAEGWLQWRERQLSGAATGTGSALAYGGARIAGADLSIKLDQNAGYPVRISSSLRDLAYGGISAHTVTIKTDGTPLPGHRFEIDGSAACSGGTLRLHNGDGEVSLVFTSAVASWGWRGDTLAGALSLAMAEQGKARTEFRLPVPARFPVAVDRKGPLKLSLTGQAQVKGIMTALFPGLVRESFGELDATLAVGGSWDAPRAGGTVRLVRGGAYLTSAGIHLHDVQFTAQLEKNLVRIDSFRALSGPGHIEGTALLTLAGWRVTGYRGTIRGENFQVVYFPELKVLSTPDLSFTGTPHTLELRGELRLPELRIDGAPPRSAIVPSSDVIREGRRGTAVQSPPLVPDIRVRVVLGERVFVKVAGIDAQLGGAMDLSLSSFDRIAGSGEIKVAHGRYRTYGVNLEIIRGRLYYAGGPIDRPTLDFLALRSIGDVRAGVTVTGTLQKPVTKLYSEPAMPDMDVLAYIVLGHPLVTGSQQAGLVAQAAGALLTSGQAEHLQEQIKNRLGLSTLDIQGGVGGTTTAMGYKPLPVTAPGAMPAERQPGITETVLTVGKYVTPQLYISYGKSLFSGNNLFRIRYDIFKRWQIETQTGNGESGADLFYKLEFK